MKNAGFTLIETLVYLALFGIIIGGISVIAYAMIEAAGRGQTRTTAQEEAGFLLGKLNWALTGASSITVTPTSLNVNKFVGPSLVFSYASPKLQLGGVSLNSDAVTMLPPTDTNCSATKVIFNDIPAQSGKPEGVRVCFILRTTTPRGAIIDQSFQTTKYLRQ